MARATVDFPDVLVQRDIDRLIDAESNHASHTAEGLQQWLDSTGQTIDEVRERLHDGAQSNVRRALVLGELASVIEIEIDDDRVSDEIDSLVQGMSGGESAPEEQLATVRGMVDTPEGRASISNRLLTQDTLARLEEIASQPEEEDAAEPVRGRRRSRRRSSGASDDASDEQPQASADDPVSEPRADDAEPSNDP